ncbi:alpha/beta hydrolase [Nocardia terpenica]|uniref:alpha/beta fold hydrolase n=1 Tax=Nocardia terpenica TaxID=455432 RepID=UPI001895A67C|nr:alpha/beta hydrolase [Nocardia terpenica]MBF6060105.1 alpha/beta hydrolase [Nocardia terpenica]MBF6103365.1 alpha/beta hydrolase [Nocardia terpenica]MBF6112261.1 alpha/beta hydrolase [Nocardia terpenica]MBF6117586.1 alpha/beta hydrolase [Nocardia terpenica]MBF6153670.1 alpha/beta hydrolase [Nocardia terpenica]
MLVKMPEAMTGLRADAVTAAYRAKLRSRSYDTPTLNVAPSPEIVPVTAADGARLRVHAHGPADGEVIVLIHGWSCCIEYWNPQINAFADEYRVVAYDQRGHGESEMGTRRFGADQLADDLSEVLDAVLRPGQRAVLVGHSMGGITIQAWAQRYPEQVAERASAVLLATTAARRIPQRAKVVPLLNDVWPAPVLLAQALFGTPVPLPGSIAARLIFKSRIMNRACDADQADFGLAIVRSCRPAARAAVARGLARMDLGDAAAHLTVPTSVVAGRYDKLLPAVHSEEIAEILAAAGTLDRYTVLPTGHLPNIEAAQEFNAELHRMVRIARRGAGAVAS